MIRLHNLWNGAKVCKGKFIALNYFICEQGEKKKLRLLTLKKEKRTNKIKENRWNNKWNRADDNLIELNREPRNKPE